MKRVVIAFLAGLALSGCQLPNDPEKTTEQVRGDTLKVGVLTAQPPEPDRKAVALIASALQAEPKFVTGDPHLLLDQLRRGKLHLLVGAIPASSSFQKHTGVTNPIGHVTVGPQRFERIMLIRRGENGFLFEVNKAIQPLTREASA